MTKEDLLFWIATIIITWIIAHLYYKRAHKDQMNLYKKLPNRIIKPILNANKKKISVRELNVLLSNKTIDKGSEDPLPYKACPECGSENIEHGSDVIVDEELGDGGERVVYGTPYGTIKCNHCGWDTDELNEYYREK